MTTPDAWRVEHHSGDPRALHGRDVLARPARTVWWFEPDRRALVLGSSQRDDVADLAALDAGDVTLVRRRSGGGAVLLEPGELTWVDVVVPRHDPLWRDDVGHAFEWLGDAWAEVLRAAGHDDVRVHRGALLRTEWSPLVCFGGTGPGEVLVAERKVVGISQRRTAAGARFQCAVLRRWRPGALLALLALEPAERARAVAALEPVAAGVEHAGDELVAALVARLPA